MAASAKKVVLNAQLFPATGGQVPPAMAGHSPGTALPHNPQQARRLLAEANYPGGRRFPTVELLMASGRGAVIDDLQAQWLSNLEVQVTGGTIAWASLLDRMYREPPHIVGMASAAHYPDPATFVGLARRDDGHAAHVWQHAAYNRLAAEAAQVTDEAQRLGLFQQINRIVVEEAWLVPLWYGRRHLLFKPWVVRLPTSPIMGCFWKDVIVEPHQEG